MQILEDAYSFVIDKLKSVFLWVSFAKVYTSVFNQIHYFEGWFLLGVGSTLLFVCCRYLSSSSPELYYSNRSPLLSTPASGSSSFIPTPPPNLSQLLVRQQIHRTRKASPSSLPGRLNRALSLGTIPSLARAGECMSAAGSNEKKKSDWTVNLIFFVQFSLLVCYASYQKNVHIMRQ